MSEAVLSKDAPQATAPRTAPADGSSHAISDKLVLSVDNVSKVYPGVRALDQVSLDCRAGEVHAILGENGSGKSTLMKIASGTVVPDGGTVMIDGTRLSDPNPRLAHDLGLSTVYQDDSLVRELTVAQNLYMGAPAGSVSYGGMTRWAREVLKTYDLAVKPGTLVGDLTPAHRQFVEIVKALLSQPKVLLLDEPTSTLDLDGVRKLSGLIRELTAKGTGILYVSHRLPEILELADRVSILRDGVHQGTFPVTPDLSETHLVSLMIGRDIESEYPPKPAQIAGDVVLSVRNLNSEDFADISFEARRGEILGFAGAEGNGQREALRAIGGLGDAVGQITCSRAPVSIASPRDALAGGVLFLSADRIGEAVFPDLGVGKNLMLTRLRDAVSGGLLSTRIEQDQAANMVRDFGVVTASLETPIVGLSGGNQQKVALARSFRSQAKAILIDEPTQGVDAGARHEIYQAVRENIAGDGTCIINSSDGQELAGICDRVLVFSRGRIVRELTGDDVTEENIVSSFLTARDAKDARADEEAEADTLGGRILRTFLGGSVTWWVPLIFLAILMLGFGGYAASANENFLGSYNIRSLLLSTAPFAIVAMAQMHVLLVRGLDVSVGSMMSVTVVAASFLFARGTEPWLILVGVMGCLLIGIVVGFFNAFLIRIARINAIIATIAMLSVLQGVALLARPVPEGRIAREFMSFMKDRIEFIPYSLFFLILIAVVMDLWLYRTRSGLAARAVGFRDEAARRNGVRVNMIHVRAYVLAAFFAALAGLFAASEVGVGDPRVGSDYTLASIAAAVLGGAALTGGRGSFLGAFLGAMFFALTRNVISLLGLSASVADIASGVLTLLAIFLYTGLGEVEKVLSQRRRRRRLARAATAV